MNYITILDFMVDDLKLKGNELIVYALIYGFCQDDTSSFYGSLSYIKERTGISTDQTVLNVLNGLMNKNLLKKSYFVDENKEKRCSYMVLQKLENGTLKNACECTLKNRDNNKTNIKDIYKEIIEKYTEDEELRSSLIDFVENRKQMKKPVTVLALQKNLNKLSSLTSSNNIKRLIVNTSIENGWSSFYPLREQSVQSTKVDKSSYDVQFDESGRVIYE